MKAGMQHLVCGFCGNIFVIFHGNQFSKMFNSKMVILTSSETNNHSNNVDFVTKIIHLRSE